MEKMCDTTEGLLWVPAVLRHFAAHRLILAKNSEVFDRMLSQRWNGEKKDLEMVEDAPCQKVFPAFLRFLYCNHVVLHQDNCLPILILADKYNVISLKKVSVLWRVSSEAAILSLCRCSTCSYLSHDGEAMSNLWLSRYEAV
ncbi:BTB/POZ domain protein [Cooperia oncophora]